MRKTLGLTAALLLGGVLLTVAQTVRLQDRPEHFERSRDFDVLHYKLVFFIDVPARTVRGEAAVTLTSLKDDLGTIALDAEQLQVNEVLDTEGRSLAFEQGGGRLTIAPPRALSWGEKTTLSVRYVLRDPARGLKFISATPEHPAQVNTYNWPEEARRWFPCFDSPNDKATSEVLATVPGEWKVLSNGRLVGTAADPASGTATFHWLQDKPHPTYNIMLAAGPFAIFRDALGELPVNAWVYPRDLPDAPRSFAKTPRMIDFFNRMFAYPYPWAKYDQVCIAGYGGGMEATSATMLGDDTIHDARADQDFPSDGLVAHELAHQWWGDLVTERHWTDVWLSESFATYAEHLWTRHDRGEDEGDLDLEEKKEAYLEEARTSYIRPLVFNRYENPWDVMDGHSYPKGAAVLHVLRFVLGDKPFFRALSLFLHRFEFRCADTHDFMTAVKDATGENMDWFFDQWVFRPGHPVFRVGWTWDEASAKARVKVVQDQDPDRGVPLYRIPVRIGIVTAAGKRVEKRWLARREEELAFDAPQKPLLVVFDEGHHLLKEIAFPKTAEELAFQMAHDDVVGRRNAAMQLADKSGEPGVFEALKGAARSDPSWSVRRAALRSAAGADAAACAGLLRDAALDPHSQVRAEAIRLLGGFRDGSLSAFFMARFGKDDSYLVQAACLAALGECGGLSSAAFLRKAAAMPSPRGLLRKTAETALKELARRPRGPGPARRFLMLAPRLIFQRRGIP